jgi:hypothetical protein
VIALLVVGSPAAGFGQIGGAARAGTLGIGGEVSVAVAPRITLRGGVGALPFEYNSTYSDLEYTVSAPATIWNLGIDFHTGVAGLRLSAGVLHRSQFDLEGHYTGTTQIGGQTYNGTLDVTGAMKNDTETAPYFAIGFGRTRGRGIGLFLDAGMALLGDGRIRLTGTCDGCGTAQQQFQNSLDEEAAQAEDDFGEFLKVHPVLQIGLRLGL